MMRLLLASVAAAALLPGLARAQAVVVCASCPTELQEILRQGERLAQGAQVIQQGGQQIQEAQMMFRAVTGVRDVGSAASALAVLGIQNPLPVNPYAAQALMNGSGGTQGMLSNLGSLYTGAGSANRVYVPTIRSWIGEQLGQQQRGLAGRQAIQMQLYQSAGERAQQIAILRERIATATDPATRAALGLQLQAAMVEAASQQQQALAAIGFGQGQIALREQQREEFLQRGIDREIAEGRRRGYIQ